jgi:alpha-tubulin suppressor-like RCC1 family protein
MELFHFIASFENLSPIADFSPKRKFFLINDISPSLLQAVIYHKLWPPQEIPLPKGQVPVSFSGGMWHLAILTSQGKLLTSATTEGPSDVLGREIESDEKIPIEVPFFHGKVVIAVSCGFFHTAVITSENGGSLYTFGSGMEGQLGYQEENQPLPIEVGFFRKNPITSVTCGNYFTVVITKDEKLYLFGSGKENREDEPKPSIIKEIEFFRGKCPFHVSCGDGIITILTADRRIYTFTLLSNSAIFLGREIIGRNWETPEEIPYFRDKSIKEIDCRHRHTILSGEDGKIYIFGSGAEYEKGDPLEFSNLSSYDSSKRISYFENQKIDSISCGFENTIVVIDGSPLIFGYGFPFVLGPFVISEIPFSHGKVHQVLCHQRYIAMMTRGDDPELISLFIGNHMVSS